MPWIVEFGLCLLGMAVAVVAVILLEVVICPNDALVDNDEEGF